MGEIAWENVLKLFTKFIVVERHFRHPNMGLLSAVIAQGPIVRNPFSVNGG